MRNNDIAHMVLLILGVTAVAVLMHVCVAERCRSTGGLIITGTHGTSCIESPR